MPRPSSVRRVPFGFSDRNPQRNRLLRNITDSVNEVSGVAVEVKAPATANQEFTVRHELGRVPREVEIVRQDKAGAIYRSRPALWTKNAILLKYSQAGGTLSIRLR